MPNAKVLVVDANQDSRAALAHALTEAGYEAAVATSGSFALTMLEWEQPDLIVSYAKVQDMDGYELYQALRERYPKLPVLMMTAFTYDRDHVIKRSRLEGLQGVLFKKPVDPKRLIDVLAEATHR